ncbi:MAG TPA: ABC transporter ATP-binding protein [Candidatus Dormibacteraeota bacterium]|jgi:predicted ABC-type transport system involved in lysophospholipase L1 biosynthesis ATPase subunit
MGDRGAATSGARSADGETPSFLVRVRDLFKIYREGPIETVALRGAGLDLPRGRVASLVGPSGSGKSTLIAILAGLTLPSAGQVLFDGDDVTRLDEPGRARLRSRRTGLVLQRDNLVPFLTATENVELAIGLAGGRRAGRGARELLGELGLGQRQHHLPRRLSGGEAQRVAVAVALANQPDLLLADELTGELDSATAERVMETILESGRQRGLTVLLVTHNADVAARADHRLRLLDGVVVTR